MSSETDLDRVATFERNFQKIVAKVEELRVEMVPYKEQYDALVARAAGGDDVADDDWAAVEAEISALTRKAMRCFHVLRRQQHELAKINADLATIAAEQIAKTFCFLSPVSGHA
jgi:hypothetical protein